MPKLFSKSELQYFYKAIESDIEKAKFLLYASSGRRRMEVLTLTRDQVDLKRRVMMPSNDSKTKHTWHSFFNGVRKSI
jgi:integrase